MGVVGTWTGARHSEHDPVGMSICGVLTPYACLTNHSYLQVLSGYGKWRILFKGRFDDCFCFSLFFLLLGSISDHCSTRHTLDINLVM